LIDLSANVNRRLLGDFCSTAVGPRYHNGRPTSQRGYGLTVSGLLAVRGSRTPVEW